MRETCFGCHLQVKGLSIEELAARNDLVLALPDRIQSIPDGTPAPQKNGGWTSGWGSSATHTEIKFDSGHCAMLLNCNLGNKYSCCLLVLCWKWL